MAWYCEYLIMHSVDIRENEDIDSDIYSDLLSLESALVTLHKEGKLNPKDIFVLSYYIDLSELGITGKQSQVSKKRFYQALAVLANKIGNFLGCHFTDDGYIEHLKDIYNISEIDAQRVKHYMVSKYRYRLIKKPYRETNELI